MHTTQTHTLTEDFEPYAQKTKENPQNQNHKEAINRTSTTQPPEKFKNKYRIKSARLPGYDYSSNGAYFITICTANREHFFGKIINGKMELSEIGKIVANEWQKTAEIRKNVKLGEWIVMPNHFHGILITDNNDTNVETPQQNVETPRRGVSTEGRGVSTGKQNPNHKPEWKSGCVGAIINQFKSVCTKQIRKFHELFAWQTRFHDIIIRNEREFEKISEYIKYNPQKWENDCYFKTKNNTKQPTNTHLPKQR